jgi:hypothetical protein
VIATGVDHVLAAAGKDALLPIADQLVRMLLTIRRIKWTRTLD